VSGKTARVIGGSEVYDTTTIPWIVGILNRTAEGPYFKRHYCGGSIIDQLWILTAAHCVYGTQAHEISILASTYNLSDMDMGFLRNVSVVHIHEYYDDRKLENDIALLKLEKPVGLNDSDAIISLADKNHPRNPGQIYTLAGWGAISFNRTIFSPSWEPILKTANVAEVSQHVCKSFLDHNETLEMFELFNETLEIDDTHICAGNVVGENACYGDSGGPLSMTVDSTDIQYGIVSWGLLPCGREGPTVYTDVAMYQDWIANITGLPYASSNTVSNVTVFVVIGIVAGLVFFGLLIMLDRRNIGLKRNKKAADLITINENISARL